jgi:DNA-binding NarL/FixJ family response regulator
VTHRTFPRNVAFIDDNPLSNELFRILIEQRYNGTIDASFFCRCEDFLERLVPNEWGLVVVDYQIDGSQFNGPQCREAIAAIDPNIRIYLSTVYGYSDSLVKEWGFAGYIPKESSSKILEILKPFAT